MSVPVFKINDIAIENNSLDERYTIRLQDDWWTSSYSTGIQKPVPPVKLLPITHTAHRGPSETRKPNNSHIQKTHGWEIRQGDYRIKEKYKEMTNNRRRNKIILKLLVLVFVLINILLTSAFAGFLASR